MTREEPLVSILMIFLNGEAYMDEAVRSVLEQTYTRWELLLVDDGSTDRSTEMARAYAASHPGKIRYLEHEGHVNLGMSATRNLGIRHAEGEYIAILDADDVWLPAKLERQVAILAENPTAGMVYGRTEYWHGWTGDPADAKRDHVPEHGVPEETLFEPPELLTRVYPLGPATAPGLCSLLVRTEVVRRVGGFEESFRGCYEDQAFLTKVYLEEFVYVSGECLDRYRIHPQSCSSSVRSEGNYEEFRESFLRWLKGYLIAKGVGDKEVWNSFDGALEPFEDSARERESEYRWLRLLRVADGNEARLVFPPDNPDVTRIEIAKAGTEPAYDIQLNKPRLHATANHEYVVNFLVRADAPRKVSFGFAMGHAPWTNLGLHWEIDATAEWRPIEARFTATEDDENARIYFDVGNSDVSVEISSVSLKSLTEGRLVKPRTQSAQPLPTTYEPNVELGKVQFGSLRRVTPISDDFGADRGKPVDRYYIENFLDAHRTDVRGRVLEVGERSYTRRFGDDRVVVSDVLHVVEGNPEATIIADLTAANHIPSDTFDCIILTQTLQLLYDVREGVKTLYRILKPGGVLLATFPGISQTYDNEWGDTWFWNYTTASARRLFGEVFPQSHLSVETFGNVLTAVSFLHGLAVDELAREELDYRDPGYDVTITVRGQKPGGDGDDRPRRSEDDVDRPPAPKGLVLMYHRVTEGITDPWSLCVSPEHFREHLDVLGRLAKPTRLQELASDLRGGAIADRSVAITFDDGYVDNLHNAKPLLEDAGIPATVFITTGYIGGDREFWWDELDRLFLQPGTLPPTLEMIVDGTEHEWNLGDAAVYSTDSWRSHRDWKAEENPPTARHRVFLEVWRLLQPLSEEHRRRLLDMLRAWAGAEASVRPSHRVMTATELVELAGSDAIEIGCHTVTHALLPDIPAPSVRAEVEESTAALDRLLGAAPKSFAYPYGAYSQETIPAVRDAGFSCAVSTVETCVRATSDPYQLPRMEVRDWSGEEFERRLLIWLGEGSIAASL